MSKSYEEEEIVAIVEECLRGNFELTAFKYSISEHKLYRWCRQYRRPSFSTLQKISRLQEEVMVLGKNSLSQDILRNLVKETIYTDIVTFRSMLECDYFYLNCEEDIPRKVSNYDFRTEVKSAVSYINSTENNKKPLERYIKNRKFSAFNNESADMAFLSSIVYLANAMYIFDDKELDDEKLELCTENIEVSKNFWIELGNLIDIELCLIRRKNLAGTNKTKENSNEARKKSEDQESELLELIKSAIDEIKPKEAYRAKDSLARQGDIIAKKIHHTVTEKTFTGIKGPYRLSNLNELSCYIHDILRTNASISSLYAEKCKSPQSTATPAN
jgi:hypothetical protein